VHLQNQLLFLRHRGEVAVEAIEDNHSRGPFFDLAADRPSEFLRPDFAEINLRNRLGAALDMLSKIKARCLGPNEQCADALIEFEEDRGLAALAGRVEVLKRHSRFAGFCGPRDKRGSAAKGVCS
jgi:hypothetical protein